MSCSSSNPAEALMPQDIQDKIHNHPCYSEGAHHHYARIHVAVAPACNIQCNYCNRKYDCSNESRPGVTSERLTPEESAKKVMYVGGEVQRLSVLGIAGPGDPPPSGHITAGRTWPAENQSHYSHCDDTAGCDARLCHDCFAGFPGSHSRNRPADHGQHSNNNDRLHDVPRVAG